MSTEPTPSNLVPIEQREAVLAELTTPGKMTLATMKLLQETICKGGQPEEIKLFGVVCGRTKLDPFMKQIHFVKRWDSTLKKEVAAHQVGIDGFRIIAQRSERYQGTVGPMWCGKDGVWKELWTEDVPPFAAKVGVRVAGWPEPVWAIARWKAYAQTKRDGGLTSMWATRDAEQLAKCAEALAHRIAFPNDLSQLYAPEELPETAAEPVTQESNTTKHLKRDKKVREKAAESLAEVLSDAGDAPTDMGAGTDASPDERGPYGPPDDDDPRSPEDKGEVLANSGTTHDDVVIALIALRKAAEKDGRKFFEIKTGGKVGTERYALIDGELLIAAGQIERGVAKPCWLDNLKTATDKWLALCVAIVKTGQQYNLEIVR